MYPTFNNPRICIFDNLYEPNVKAEGFLILGVYFPSLAHISRSAAAISALHGLASMFGIMRPSTSRPSYQQLKYLHVGLRSASRTE
jgi:hypothetical protein